MAKAKRVVIISDLHCGHRAGLTPPAWHYRITNEEEAAAFQKWAIVQKECWDWYRSTMSKLRPIDVLIVNGDCIDGTGRRSGGTELVTTDRDVQCQMACKCLQVAKAKKVLMVRGTPYHTGEEEDMENHIARTLPADKIGDHEWYNINGVTFDVKHFIGSSTIPHGRVTALLRDQLWNRLWAMTDQQPEADIMVRSHVHYAVFAGGHFNGRLKVAMTTPALQSHGSKYGAKKCSGLVDFGITYIDIDAKGNYSCPSVITANLPHMAASALVV